MQGQSSHAEPSSWLLKSKQHRRKSLKLSVRQELQTATFQGSKTAAAIDLRQAPWDLCGAWPGRFTDACRKALLGFKPGSTHQRAVSISALPDKTRSLLKCQKGFLVPQLRRPLSSASPMAVQGERERQQAPNPTSKKDTRYTGLPNGRSCRHNSSPPLLICFCSSPRRCFCILSLEIPC